MNLLASLLIMVGMTVCIGAESPYLTNLEVLGQGLVGIVTMGLGARLYKGEK